jgi:hypothetical protein
MLKTAFEYEVRNYIDIHIQELNAIDDLDEKGSDRLRELQTVKEFLLKRIGEMKS